jgi:DNA polymerase epsilon subunit 1
VYFYFTDTMFNFFIYVSFRLKKNLLRLLNVREFAPEAAFVNPCLSYVLPDVMCEFCNYGRDLDLLRDAPASSSGGAPSFACTSCGHPYNRKQMEATLVEIVQKRDLG